MARREERREGNMSAPAQLIAAPFLWQFKNREVYGQDDVAGAAEYLRQVYIQLRADVSPEDNACIRVAGMILGRPFKSQRSNVECSLEDPDAANRFFRCIDLGGKLDLFAHELREDDWLSYESKAIVCGRLLDNGIYGLHIFRDRPIEEQYIDIEAIIAYDGERLAKVYSPVCTLYNDGYPHLQRSDEPIPDFAEFFK
jgi:hypothetical protein